MAFTPAELLSIAKIVGITPSLLNAHISSLGVTLTSDIEDAVRDEITRWTDGAGASFVKIWPKESNKGVETNAGDVKSDIRRNIAVLLELFDYVNLPMSIGTIQIAAPSGY